MYWLIVIFRRQRFMYYLIPWLYFYSSCKNMFAPFIIDLFVVEAIACSKRAQLYFLWFVQSKMYFVLGVFFLSGMIHLLPSISVIDWFEESSSHSVLSLLYLGSHFETKKQSCFHSSCFFWFVLTLRCSWNNFFSSP